VASWQRALFGEQARQHPSFRTKTAHRLILQAFGEVGSGHARQTSQFPRARLKMFSPDFSDTLWGILLQDGEDFPTRNQLFEPGQHKNSLPGFQQLHRVGHNLVS
jgi:hypothetical protein